MRSAFEADVHSWLYWLAAATQFGIMARSGSRKLTNPNYQSLLITRGKVETVVNLTATVKLGSDGHGRFVWIGS
jgi:hypothetical protein